MIFDDELDGSELDELQQLAAQFMDDASGPAPDSGKRPTAHSDDFDIVPLEMGADRQGSM
jgi:hypothetical protein